MMNHPKIARSCFAVIVALGLCEPLVGKNLPASFRDAADLSYSERKALARSADHGDSTAALSLARYYALIDKKPSLRERFLKLAIRAGSEDASDALVAFYVEPGGTFRPKEALSLRRKFAKSSSRKTMQKEKDWAYRCSLAFRYSNDPKDVYRRRELLQLAEALGSKQAREELADVAHEKTSKVHISPSNLEDATNDTRSKK